MNFKKIICIGDSWCAGGELFDPSIFEKDKNGVYIGDEYGEQNIEYRLNNSWPKRLSELYNCDVENLGVGGLSNAGMARKVRKYYFEEMINNRDPKDTLAIISFTSLYRMEFYNPMKENFLQVRLNHPHPNRERELIKAFINFGFDRASFLYTYLNIIYDLQNFFKIHEIPYLFTQAFDNPLWDKKLRYHNPVDNRLIYERIDSKNFLGFKLLNNTFFNVLIGNYSEENYQSLKLGEDVTFESLILKPSDFKSIIQTKEYKDRAKYFAPFGHPSEEGHKLIAKFLKENIDEL